MNLINKIINKELSLSKKKKKNTEEVRIYLDSELRRSIQTTNQTVLSYYEQNQLQSQQDQFLYLMVKSKKTEQELFRRKLNSFQKFLDVLNGLPEETQGYLVMGYNSNTIPRISNGVTIAGQANKFIRSGTLYKLKEAKNSFEDCQLMLHHDYLTYYKDKTNEKKVSFLPLQNSVVEMVNQKQFTFIVKDKFKTITFKTTSKEDMIGWLIAINDAIKIRNAQIYMSELNTRLDTKIKQKIQCYSKKCLHLRDQSRNIFLDEIGRKCLKQYFKKSSLTASIQNDVKLFTIVDTYLYMCKCVRQKGDSQVDEITQSIKEALLQLKNLPEELGQKVTSIQSKGDIVKIVEEIMKYLDKKYKKQLLEKHYLYNTFQSHLLEQYKENSKIPMRSILGHFTVNT